MKALIKPSSKQYFKRFQQQAEDLETTMNNIESKKIGKFVGIDPNQSKNFTWFFEIISKLKFPNHFTRHLNEKKDEVIYLNLLTHQQTYQHPSISILKTMFYQTLANNKAIYTFVDKQSKLLPFVEQKMLRQCIGISSKRRDAQKVNLQRDETGKMAMSKLQRINPDFKGLLASRSYMLKMLVQKVFTRKEVLGKGKRANAYTSIINDYKQMMKQAQPQQDYEIVNQEDIELYQRIFQQSAYFYLKQFGNLEAIPSKIINSRQYMESTPENVLKNIFLLNIDKDNIQLYWLARMMDCLPFPPNWSKKKGSSFDSYLYEPEKILFDIHPSYIYILHQINRFKNVFQKLTPIRQNYYINMRQLNFFDFFQRKYTVDMYGYIERSINTSSKVKAKDKTKISKYDQVSDWMILEGVNNSPLTQKYYVLLQHIQAFWKNLDFVAEPWCPSISPYGEVIWSSNVNNKSLTINPYRPKLSVLIKTQMKKTLEIKEEVIKKQYRTKKQQNKQDQDDFIHLNIDKLIKQREDFLDYYLTHQDKAMPWPYQIKSKHPFLNQQNYCDQIFYSPFILDQYIVPKDQPLPLWLQKCKAKQHTVQNTNLLLFNPQDFNQTKQKIAKYALDMVSEHQPYLTEQTQKKLNRIINAEQLIKFLNYINDLDLREHRKKEYLQSLKLAQSDSDIFGSQISQMQIEEAVQDQESIEQSAKQQSQQVSEKSTIKHKSIQSEEQSQVVEVAQKIPVIEETIPEPQRQQYQFLKHFKKRYTKNYKLQNLKDEQLNINLRQLIKKKIKVSKFKRGLILKKINKQIKIVKELLAMVQHKDQLDLKQARWNLILTHLRHSLLPYRAKKDIKKIKFNHKGTLSQVDYSEITDYSQFQSQISQYNTDQIEQIVEEARKQKLAQKKLKTLTQRSHNQHQVTNDTIQFQPIHQIKPQIQLDPVLRHIRSVSTQLKDFRSTFIAKNKNPSIQKDEQQRRQNFGIRKVISLKNMEQKVSNYHSTPANIASSRSTKKEEKIELNSRLSLAKREGMGAIPRVQQQRPFYRVCLDHTASHFLGKEAFLRKGDIITMQARKTLLSKGRGIQTFISKFY